jgi:hypothetical protein
VKLKGLWKIKVVRHIMYPGSVQGDALIISCIGKKNEEILEENR